MFDYTGYKCKSCGNEFSENDDIVVCPDCGTPYHRDCYHNEGKCVNFELHDKHISWKADNEQKGCTVQRCKNCGGVLSENQLFCDKCGTATEYYLKTNPNKADNVGARNGYNPVNDYSANANNNPTEALYPYMINYSDPLCGFNPEEEYENGLTTKDIADFVGQRTYYYLPKFRIFKLTKLKLSMNIAAMFFPELYFANRKMPFAAFLIMMFNAIIGFPANIASVQEMLKLDKTRPLMLQAYPFLAEYSEKILALDLNSDTFVLLMNIATILSWISIIIFAGLSNYWYYRHVISKGAAIKALAEQSDTSASELLRIHGGTSAGMMILFIALSFVVQILSIAAVVLIL